MLKLGFTSPGIADIAADQPFSTSFNVAVNHIAARLWPKGFDVCNVAPSSLESLKNTVRENGRLTVWGGGSERTIFGDAETNYAFRAWHDWHHIDGDLPFTFEGEAEVCQRQLADLARLYGNDTMTQAGWAALLVIEVIGQRAYEDRHGAFPDDQRAFAVECLRHGWAPVVNSGARF